MLDLPHDLPPISLAQIRHRLGSQSSTAGAERPPAEVRARTDCRPEQSVLYSISLCRKKSYKVLFDISAPPYNTPVTSPRACGQGVASTL